MSEHQNQGDSHLNVRLWWAALPFAAVILSTAGGCGEVFSNQTASFGGPTAGERGLVQVLFINNTPHRVVFTYGSYDQTDRDSQPDFQQFGLEDFDTTLDGHAISEISTLTCARVFSIGSSALLALIEENLPGATVIEDALIEGVEFWQVDSDGDPDGAEAVTGRVGFAPPFEALLGVDFPCNALLIIRFELDDLGPDAFQVNFELIPSESVR